MSATAQSKTSVAANSGSHVLDISLQRFFVAEAPALRYTSPSNEREAPTGFSGNVCAFLSSPIRC